MGVLKPKSAIRGVLYFLGIGLPQYLHSCLGEGHRRYGQLKCCSWIQRGLLQIMFPVVRSLQPILMSTTLTLLGLGSFFLYYNPSTSVIFDLHCPDSSWPNWLSLHSWSGQASGYWLLLSFGISWFLKIFSYSICCFYYPFV